MHVVLFATLCMFFWVKFRCAVENLHAFFCKMLYQWKLCVKFKRTNLDLRLSSCLLTHFYELKTLHKLDKISSETHIRRQIWFILVLASGFGDSSPRALWWTRCITTPIVHEKGHTRKIDISLTHLGNYFFVSVPSYRAQKNIFCGQTRASAHFCAFNAIIYTSLCIAWKWPILYNTV